MTRTLDEWRAELERIVAEQEACRRRLRMLARRWDVARCAIRYRLDPELRARHAARLRARRAAARERRADG